MIMDEEAPKRTSLGRIFSFILLILVGALLQLWVVFILLVVKGPGIDIGLLLKDGGLFFFSTSLTYNSLFSLVDKYPLKFGNLHFNVSVVSVGLVTILAIVVYSLVQNDVLQLEVFSLSQSAYILSQIACTAASLAYAFYVASVTGLFEETP